MTLYVIIAREPNVKLAQKIGELFPNDHRQLKDDQWLVSAQGKTTQNISDELGISDGDSGSAIVFATSGYYGRYTSDTWEWIDAKLEEPSNG